MNSEITLKFKGPGLSNSPLKKKENLLFSFYIMSLVSSKRNLERKTINLLNV